MDTDHKKCPDMQVPCHVSSPLACYPHPTTRKFCMAKPQGPVGTKTGHKRKRTVAQEQPCNSLKDARATISSRHP